MKIKVNIRGLDTKIGKPGLKVTVITRMKIDLLYDVVQEVEDSVINEGVVADRHTQ